MSIADPIYAVDWLKISRHIVFVAYYSKKLIFFEI